MGSTRIERHSPNTTKQRINICDTHFKRHVIDPFLKQIITGDEKCMVYNNVNRKISKDQRKKHYEPAQTISKVELYQKKIKLSVAAFSA